MKTSHVTSVPLRADLGSVVISRIGKGRSVQGEQAFLVDDESVQSLVRGTIFAQIANVAVSHYGFWHDLRLSSLQHTWISHEALQVVPLGRCNGSKSILS